MSFYSAPPYVVACEFGPATVLVNYRTGRLLIVLGPAASWWSDLATSGDASVSRTLLPADRSLLCEQLVAAGLLVRMPEAKPWSPPVVGKPGMPSWGTQEVSVGLGPPPRAPVRARLAAAAALALVLVVRHVGRRCADMQRLISMLRWCIRRADQPATPAQAYRAVAAVRRVANLFPGRVACLEESAAVVFLLSASRRWVTWCHGVAADPVRLHAWVRTSSGHAVAEPPSTELYTPLLTITHHPHKGDEPLAPNP